MGAYVLYLATGGACRAPWLCACPVVSGRVLRVWACVRPHVRPGPPERQPERDWYRISLVRYMVAVTPWPCDRVVRCTRVESDPGYDTRPSRVTSAEARPEASPAARRLGTARQHHRSDLADARPTCRRASAPGRVAVAWAVARPWPVRVLPIVVRRGLREGDEGCDLFGFWIAHPKLSGRRRRLRSTFGLDHTSTVHTPPGRVGHPKTFRSLARSAL